MYEASEQLPDFNAETPDIGRLYFLHFWQIENVAQKMYHDAPRISACFAMSEDGKN
jgi:hypothetical protein